MASGAVDFGSLPSAGLGGELGAGVLFRPLRVEAMVADWLAQSATSGTDGTRLHFVDVTARGCYVIPLRRALDLSSCFGGGVAWASSTGFGESQPENQTALWGLFRADAIVAWSVLPNLALRLSAGTLIPVAPPSFVALHGAITSSVLHQPSAFAGRGGLGVEARFP